MLYENRLNGVAEDIGSAIGYTATCTLIEWYGGRQVWIPLVAEPTNEIARVIGWSAYRRLVDLFPNQRIMVPVDHFRELCRRDRVVAIMTQGGNGSKQIAACLGLTERQVQNIRRKLEEAGVLNLVLNAPVPE